MGRRLTLAIVGLTVLTAGSAVAAHPRGACDPKTQARRADSAHGRAKPSMRCVAAVGRRAVTRSAVTAALIPLSSAAAASLIAASGGEDRPASP
jgi:hypothetical protein